MNRTIRRAKSFIGLAIAASMLAACAGNAGPSNGIVPGMSPGFRRFQPDAAKEFDASKRNAKARVEIRIPRHRHRGGHFVSPNTASMKIVANGSSLGTFGLTPASKGCATDDGATQCTFTIGVPTGKVKFAVSLYDKAKALLSQGTVTVNVAAGTLAVIPLVLEGVVSSIKVSLGDEHPNAGTARSVRVYVTAYDASGAAIIGPGNYNAAISLQNSDASGITSLSTTTAARPSAKIALVYNGKSMFAATIGASATGVAPANVTSATFEPAPTVLASYSVPAALGYGSAPTAITSGPDGNVWYTVRQCNYCGSSSSGTSAIVAISPADGTMKHEYVAGTTPNLTANGGYYGIVTGPDHNVWFTDSNNKTVGKIDGSGNVTEYAAGTMCPNRITPGPDGALWFTSYCTNEIGRVTTGGTVTFNTITGAGYFREIIVAKDGNLYVTDDGNKNIWQLKIAGGAVATSTALPIPNTSSGFANADLAGLAQTSDGQLWFTNQSCPPETIGSVIINPTSFASSTVHEFQAPQGCSEPFFMTATPDRSEVFVAIWDYPVIERLIPTTPGGAPDLKNFAFETHTPNGTFQQTFDVTIGPDGSVWGTTNSSSSGYYNHDVANVVKMVY